MMGYFIKVVMLQLLFLIGYDLFLKKETFFNWNRVYLICSSLVSFILPFIKIESFHNAVPQEYTIFLPAIVLTPEKTVAPIEATWNWFLIIGISISCLLFVYKITQLVRLRFQGHFVKHNECTIIIIPKSTLAFSIFNYVFIGADIHEAKLEDILSHELVHVREKHSIDLLYFEVLRILCWFNPLVYVYQKRISELHEYIADAEIVKHKNKSDYYEKLLAEVFQTQHFSFTNQFFKHSLIKKRISMLTKQKSREILKLKYLVLIPLLLVSLVYSSCEDSSIADVEGNATATEISSKEVQLQQLIEKFNKTITTEQKSKGFDPDQFSEAQQEIIRKITEFVDAEDLVISTGFGELRILGDRWKNKVKQETKVGSNYDEFEQESVMFSAIDQAPVFPGCEDKGTLEEMKRCFSKAISTHVLETFNTKNLKHLDLQGAQRIFAKFFIDKQGNVTNLEVRAEHPDLVAEAESVIRKLPKLTPGMKDGKPVRVKYVLPIVFRLD